MMIGAAGGAGVNVAGAQQTADCDAGAIIEAAWSAYAANDIDGASQQFAEALRRCPNNGSALAGSGYVALRRGQAAVARELFERAIAVDPANVDALTGAGLVAWRQSRLADVARLFGRVQELDPAHVTAAEYLARLPDGFGPPPERPPLVRPDTVVYPARTGAGVFEVRTAGGWAPFHINGINLGAALPGRHPSEFPDSAVYAGWIAGMADMGANVVRTYTIHPPSFYTALAAYNRTHSDAPLWLVHGVWAELPPGHDFSDDVWEREFFAEMEHVVDLLHGRADIVPRAGHASGHYTADVSQWVLAWIIGREWEPFAVAAYNALRPGDVSYAGEYLVLERGTPMDAWLARACEHIVAYEMQRYNAQRPIAYTNWPTLDPLFHATETTVPVEVAMRTALGERVAVLPLEYDNDESQLDALLIRPTSQLPAGWFASYHAYPYYPDFMLMDAAYNRAASAWGRSNYYGYLEALKRHHGDVPVVIAEYGVPASIGVAHLQPQGWHHGGLTEQQMADANARMTREIAASGMAGGIIFAWIDEWFKKNWIVIDFEIPLERNRLWYNRLDAEQHYGMIAMDAAAPVAGESLQERDGAWSAVEPLYTLPDGATVRVASDEAYLWLQYRSGDVVLPDTVLVGFDIVLPGAGERTWPDDVGTAGSRAASASADLPVGIEFALRMTAQSAELMVHSPYNGWQIHAPTGTVRGEAVLPPLPDAALPGMFTGRWRQDFDRPVRPTAAGAGWAAQRVIPNRRRYGRDTTEYAAIGYNRGILRQGNAPDGLWQRDADRRIIEVRVPWGLLNVTDPSERRVLLDAPTVSDARSVFGTVAVADIGIIGASVSGSAWTSWPASGARADVARYAWPVWHEPQWRARVRPTYDAMRDAFRDAWSLALERRQ